MTPIEDLRLEPRYERALREAVAYIHDRYDPVGIVAAGTIIRGTPDPASDLDFVVAHDAPWRQRVQQTFSGVPAEIFVNPPFQIRRTFHSEAAAARPVLAHMLATGAVLSDPQGIMTVLVEGARAIIAAGPAFSPEVALQSKYMIATAFEDAVDLRHRDPERASAVAIVAVLDGIRFSFRRSGRWHPREKDLLAAFEAAHPDLGERVREAIRASSIDDQLEIARHILTEIVGATGFFEWESSRQALEPDA